MARYISADARDRVQSILFGELSGNEREKFLQDELIRYAPQLAGRTDEEIAEFVCYQREVYLSGRIPQIGRPVASLNPTFVDSTGSISLSHSGGEVYTRASVKENGYRMQLHLGLQSTSAFTRQFTRYDLRMFPELTETFAELPLMVGDAELVNKRFVHLAGFNRIEFRIPSVKYWPKYGSNGLDEELLKEYLSDPELFKDGRSLPDTEMTLAFHGLFAIAHPDTWYEPREIQAKYLTSLSKLPIDYKFMDMVLDRLNPYIQKKKLNARIVRRLVIKDQERLNLYVRFNEKQGYEGTCVVQSVWGRDREPVVAPRSVKIKTYESLDCILLGLYLKRKSDGLMEENITDALLGLYDQSLGVYLSAVSVNLDPLGVQIKTPGQKERLTRLRTDLSVLVSGQEGFSSEIITLYDAFLLQGRKVVSSLFRHGLTTARDIEAVLENIPLRSDLVGLVEMFEAEHADFCAGTAELQTVGRRFIAAHLGFFQAVHELDKNSKRRFLCYFNRVKQIKQTSAKLEKPQFVVDTSTPVIVETQVFGIKWGTSPYPAGFHSWFGNSFCFNNCFAERVRHDKSTTTDYGVVHALARRNTPK